MKKHKGQTIDLLYTNKEKSKKTKKQTNKKSKVNKTKKMQNNSKIYTNKKKQKNIKKYKIIKWITIIILIILAIIMFMMSSIFNIKQIQVINNKIISKEEIINLSKMTIETNMFKISNSTINNNIKVNPYIENVKVKRSLNGIVTLEVQERIPTYMIRFGNSYVYINNQGYMLEIVEEPMQLPIIIGFETDIQEIKEGNRLIVNDLKKLEDVIKIIGTTKNTSLENIITSIDISNKDNYKLELSSEGKVVNFGNTNNVNIKVLRIEEIIKQEKGIAGEIYFQDEEKTIFRENVKF